ncbi:MAG TPA: queuosine precursor transporter [Chthoniobacterales bacterium]|nr:queuosine precursor transporter [Chthoniobacterales bacterium]
MERANAPTLKDKTFKLYDVVSMLFVAVYLISQVASAKLFSFGPFQFPGAIIIFPFSYIFGDILTEVYGYARTRRTIWIGFFSAVLMAVTFWVVEKLPPAAGWLNQEAYEKILGIVPRVVLGSIVGYWVGEFVNSFVMAKLKIFTEGKHLWTRTIGSTLAGQAFDTAAFVLIAFSSMMPFPVLLKLSLSVYVFKVVYETVATPLTYAIVGYLKRIEGIDIYDRGTNFSPFRF